MKTRPLFIGLYDPKLMGIRYLSSVLKQNGYDTSMVFLKAFTSHNTQEPTEAEYALLYDTVEKCRPTYVGISIMCSFYLDVAKKIAAEIKRRGMPVTVGGAYATLFPEACLEFADVVFRGDSEEAILDFTNVLENGGDYSSVSNLCSRKEGTCLLNDMRALYEELDNIPFPDFGGTNKYYINNNSLSHGDPEAGSFSYEMTTSRGCPNKCSYCSTGSIRELYKGKGKFIRNRSVANVMAEISLVRSVNKGLQMLRFWDEIFPWDSDWISEFAMEYKKQVNLPFEIWGHPRFTKYENMVQLVDAGLSKIVIGVQSGSPYVRKDIYLRNEKQEEIIECSRALAKARVPIVIYDFILDHPFETEADLRETLDLCLSLEKPFTLQLHGLSFLPGTPIENIAVDHGVKTWDEIHTEQSRPLSEQYRAMHWWRIGKGKNANPTSSYWHSLIYLSQYKGMEKTIARALTNENLKKNPSRLLMLQKFYNYRLMFKMGSRKLMFMIKTKVGKK